MEARFLVCPVVWNWSGEESVAVFVDHTKAEALVRALPEGPDGGWRLFPMSELEVLAWLREQRAKGVSRLLVNAELNDDGRTMSGYSVHLPELLDSGKTLALFRMLADRHDEKGSADHNKLGGDKAP